MRCDSEDCFDEAVEAVKFVGSNGHVHDCPPHVALLREWTAIESILPIQDDECPFGCEPDGLVWISMPPRLV